MLAGLLAPVAGAFSLYDAAPPIGVPESHAVRYNAYLNAGYDDNLDCSDEDREGGGFVSFGVGASYADYESVTKLSYNANLGGQLYDKNANGTDERLFSDISLSASMTHMMGAVGTVNTSFSLSYSPDPDYANGISAARTQGDCLNWSLSNSFSQGISERWSWNANVGFSGNIYTDSYYSHDNRMYLSTGLGLSYKATERTSYGLNASYTYDFRKEGYDSENINVNASVNHALSPISSCSLSLGTQVKFVHGTVEVYPTLTGTYRRELAEGLSASVYVSLDNENVNTYRPFYGGNYLSDVTWRLGANCSYAYTHRVSFNFGATLMDSSYSDGTNGMADTSRTTTTFNVGMSYVFTESLTGNVNYQYTISNGFGYDYYRNVVSAGVSYSF